MEASQNGNERLEALQRRIEQLEHVCGEAYQFAGTVGAPERILDNLAAAANGDPIPHESVLPVTAEECNEVRSLRDRLEQVRRLAAV
jgi:hypothetical protein